MKFGIDTVGGRIDLNLLVVFDAIYQSRNLTTGGKQLGLSQPAMSHALSRLRLTFKDPLFVRLSHGLQPTPLANEIAPALVEGLAAIRGGLSRKTFDPASSTRIFNIAMGDPAEAIQLPVLVREFLSSAPHIRLHTRQVPRPAAERSSRQWRSGHGLGRLRSGRRCAQPSALRGRRLRLRGGREPSGNRHPAHLETIQGRGAYSCPATGCVTTRPKRRADTDQPSSECAHRGADIPLPRRPGLDHQHRPDRHDPESAGKNHGSVCQYQSASAAHPVPHGSHVFILARALPPRAGQCVVEERTLQADQIEQKEGCILLCVRFWLWSQWVNATPECSRRRNRKCLSYQHYSIGVPLPGFFHSYFYNRRSRLRQATGKP